MAKPDYTLFQISDTHLRADGLHAGRVDPDQRLRDAIDAISAAELQTPPAAIILSGDLGDRDSYPRLQELLAPFAAHIGAELVYLPGNHDDVEDLRLSLLGGRPFDHAYWFGGLRVIAVDSTVPGSSHGELTDDQLDWLRGELERPAPDGTVLAVHHPPVPSALEVAHRVALLRPERLGTVIAGTDVRLVVCGHNHAAACSVVGGVPVWIAPATLDYLDSLSPPDGLRTLVGGGLTRIDVFGGVPVASYVPTGATEPPLLNLDSEGLRALLAAHDAEKSQERAR